ncbi:MAG: T9SS type A sorting domain-containing protein [Candidatus Micrarchaeaceae archaeon]
MKKLIYLLAIAGTLSGPKAQAQNCGQSCYPYYFCPAVAGKLQLLCEPCPKNVPGLTPFAPGIPCVKIYNFYTDPTGGGNYYIYMDFLGGKGPIEVFDPNAVQTDVTAALYDYAIICPDLKTNNNCCVSIFLATDPSLWDQSFDPVGGHPAYDPLSNPSFSVIPINGNSCTIADCSKLKMIINFTNEYLTGNINGDPTVDPIINAFITSSQWNNLPDPIPAGFKCFSLLNDVAHEFGHILGYPEEDLVPASCALDGVMQAPSSNVNPINGLTVRDACWFKQLYCPDPCPSTSPCGSSAVLSPAAISDPFRFISLAPNPFNGATTLTYSLGNQSAVSIQVYDVLGRSVGKEINKSEAPGRQTFELVPPMSAKGTYYIRVAVNGGVHTYRAVGEGR